MTIKDIAKAANVSAATVSRIINHKDDNISQETRERVLRIIAENDYVPYAKIRDRILSQSRNIGLVVPTLNAEFYVRFASEIQKLAQEKNYSMVLTLSGSLPEAEKAALDNFARNRADGIIIFPGCEQTLSALKDLYSQGVGVVTLDHFARPASVPQLYRDSAQIARDCIRLLTASNCSQIGLALQPDCMPEVRDAILSGYTEALTAAGISLQQNFIITADNTFLESFRSMADAGLDGIVCQDAEVARLVYTAAAGDELRIPEDISVVSMEDASDAPIRLPALTAAATDVTEMARLAFHCLLCQIEHAPLPFSSQKADCPIQLRDSIRSRRTANPRILVAGYLNTDVLLRTPSVPKLGKTQVTTHIADCVGGRGANQAYGISRLGGNVCLLGRLGSDRRGRFIHDHLSRAGVKMDGVSFEASRPTGAAYISLYPNGKSSVLIDPGANDTTDPAYIRSHESLIKDASLCLAQTDIPLESVAELHRLCLLHRVPMILRPCYGVRLPAALMTGLHILIMKDQERHLLYPEFSTREECAAWFLAQGVAHVIFTEGISGCFWTSEAGSRTFPGYDYPCVDETGTSDVFIGCLATLLSEGIPMASAMDAATWAAAYSATKLGVQSGFPDRSLLLDVLSGHVHIQFEK